MKEFGIVFILNFLSSLDNILILGTIIRRYGNLNSINLVIVITLTLTRTFYILTAHFLMNIKGLHLAAGAILLVMAIVITLTKPTDRLERKNGSTRRWIRLIGTIVLTDFLVGMDSVLAISEVSKNPWIIASGLFVGFLLLVYLLPILFYGFRYFPWINMIVGAFMAQLAIISLSHDQLLKNWIEITNQEFPRVNVINFVSYSAFVGVLLLGLLSSLRFIKKE